MPLDVVDLKQFYASPLGRLARHAIMKGVRARWDSVQGLAVAGLGYAIPYLDGLRGEAERSFALMPGQQGVVVWPPDALSAAALVDPFDLPLRDSVVDRLILIHALETSTDPASLLEELWRVLAPGGHLIVVAPNRRGWWARRDSTPFGYGQPFSRRQLTELLRHALFTPVHWSEALHMPPVTGRMMLKAAPAFDRFASFLGLPFAGVHLIEATKQIYRPAVAGRRARASARLAPVLAPAPGRVGAASRNRSNPP
jgi:SAM-dependent methyltransferase